MPSKATQNSAEAPTSAAKSSTLAVVFLGLLAGLQLIAPAVANTAIVDASKSLNMSGSVVALASSISTLALAATVLPMGLLADRLGRRKVLMAALLLAAAGDAIAAASPVSTGYLAGRAIAGVGLGAILAASFAYVRFVAPPNKVASALGVWNSVLVVFFISGSLLGGALASSNWRLAMLVVPAFSLLFFFLTPAILPPIPKVSGGRPDYAGLVIIALAAISFLFGVSQAGRGLRNPEFLVPTLAGLVLFGLYYAVERKVANPIIPPALFASGIFAAAVVAGLSWNFAQAVVQLQTSNFWQYAQGFTPGRVALGQVVMMIAFAGAGFLGGRLMKPGMRVIQLMGAGFCLTFVGFVLLAFVRSGTPYFLMAIMLFIFGLGLGLISVPQAALFVAEAPKESFGPVTSFRTTTGQLGYALGFAVSSALVNAFGKRDLLRQLEAAGVPPSQLGQAVDDVRLFMQSGKAPSDELAKKAVADLPDAYAAGFDWAMAISGAATALLGIITILLLVIGMRQAREVATSNSDHTSSSDQTRG